MEIERLDANAMPRYRVELAEVLYQCVKDGASVGFVEPFTIADAGAYFDSVARCTWLGGISMKEAERYANKAGRTLLVLDTANGSRAERLYARLGWTRAGTIPGYARLPGGGLCGTTIFFKQLGG